MNPLFPDNRPTLDYTKLGDDQPRTPIADWVQLIAGYLLAAFLMFLGLDQLGRVWHEPQNNERWGSVAFILLGSVGVAIFCQLRLRRMRHENPRR